MRAGTQNIDPQRRKTQKYRPARRPSKGHPAGQRMVMYDWDTAYKLIAGSLTIPEGSSPASAVAMI